MFKTVHMGRVLGIDSYVHWSFWILLIWIGISESLAHGLLQGLVATAIVLVLFACVFLHELGHALAARSYQIRTRDITLLPIGGIARLETPPPSGLPEIVIALAGPAVNLAIAAVLWIWLSLTRQTWPLDSQVIQLSPLQQIYYVNLFLVVFNMLPAFPMDGGTCLAFHSGNSFWKSASYNDRRASRQVSRDCNDRSWVVLLMVPGIRGSLRLGGWLSRALSIASQVDDGNHAKGDGVSIRRSR